MLKKLIILLILNFKPKLTVAENNDWIEYKDIPYHITFKYPKTWQKNPKYQFRYGNNDGYFSFDAISGGNLTLEQVTELDANHSSNPYGTNPKIINKTISNQPAKLILPSKDQPELTENQAGLIIKYPTPIKIDDVDFNYLIFWAHKDYILPLSQTIKFI
ncbi:MAG: hypothetical protein N4A63_05345 [Vallitalea sp.]|jgi:hypothetical protein|nr:hypothetical protein [Vallitalea sp.]